MSITILCIHLDFCLNSMYFMFDSQFYRQINRATMGSPVSRTVCNAQMEDLEITTALLVVLLCR